MGQIDFPISWLGTVKLKWFSLTFCGWGEVKFTSDKVNDGSQVFERIEPIGSFHGGFDLAVQAFHETRCEATGKEPQHAEPMALNVFGDVNDRLQPGMRSPKIKLLNVLRYKYGKTIAGGVWWRFLSCDITREIGDGLLKY